MGYKSGEKDRTMKLKGQEVVVKNEVVVVPLGGVEHVFEAQTVFDYEPFEQRFPKPEPPLRKVPGGGPDTPVLDDPEYKKKIEEWVTSRTNWMFLKSLEATEGLEWEKVNMDDPTTWGEFETELREAGFGEVALMKILGIVTTACGLNQAKIDEATKRFLAARDNPPKE
jgi:hypothetical protein